MTIFREPDYGTPARSSAEMITLSIDGEAVSVPAGTSVMRAAELIGNRIPKLCATDSLEPFGSCRLCLVRSKAGAACRPRAPRRWKPAWWYARTAPSLPKCAAA